MKILLVHGWGYGPAIWDAVAPALKGEHEVVRADLGYFGAPDLPAGHFDLAVGHSLGLLWLLSEQGVSFDRLISLCGFARFAQAEDFQQGVRPRVLERMIRQLGKAPEEVLRAFHEQCDPNGSVPFELYGKPDPTRLVWGLEQLRDLDCRDELPEGMTVLAGREDAVVTPAMSEGNFPGRNIVWCDRPGHLLPVTASGWCVERITEALTKVVEDER